MPCFVNMCVNYNSNIVNLNILFFSHCYGQLWYRDKLAEIIGKSATQPLVLEEKDLLW